MSNAYFCFLSITEWNPETIPKLAMVDFNNGQIISPERVLPTIKIFFVNFTKSSKLEIGTIVKLSVIEK